MDSALEDPALYGKSVVRGPSPPCGGRVFIKVLGGLPHYLAVAWPLQTLQRGGQDPACLTSLCRKGVKAGMVPKPPLESTYCHLVLGHLDYPSQRVWVGVHRIMGNLKFLLILPLPMPALKF